MTGTIAAEALYQLALSDPDVPAEALALLSAEADAAEAWQAMVIAAEALAAAGTADARIAADDAVEAAWQAWLSAEARVLQV